jgi:uncharacterized tellurite resistance protein B-like protein
MALDDERARTQELREGLLRAIQDFFDTHIAEDVALPAAPEQHLQLATAVLFVSMVRADHEVRSDEHRVLVQAVQGLLGLDAERAGRLIRLAETDENRLLPLHHFVGQLRDWLSHEQKKRTLVGLWRLAYADAELQGHEEYLVRKVAELLGLGTADLVQTKIEAREASLGDP